MRFAKIIFIIEDDLSDAIESLEDCSKTFEEILNIKMFSDSPDPKIRSVLAKAMADIKTGKINIMRVVKNFTARSKQSYIRTEVIEFSEDGET